MLSVLATARSRATVRVAVLSQSSSSSQHAGAHDLGEWGVSSQVGAGMGDEALVWIDCEMLDHLPCGLDLRPSAVPML